jgi:uncharacterized membrane protein YcaP (DUF421 family)
MNGQAAIHVGDIGRALHGTPGWAFLVEALIRIVFVYLILLLAMRLMGQRMTAMLNRSELAALVALAAATGAVIGSPERGLVPPLIICALIVMAQRAQAALASRSKRAERAIEGDLSMLVIDGVLQPSVLYKVGLSRERVLAQLRTHGLTHLGLVQRLYMEAHGGFSVIKAERPVPGLSLIPEWDEPFLRELRTCADTLACSNCGQLERGAMATPRPPCAACGKAHWVPAVS